MSRPADSVDDPTRQLLVNDDHNDDDAEEGPRSSVPKSGSRAFVNRNLGLLLLLLAQLLYSSMGLSYQLLARLTSHTPNGVTPLQVIFFRMSMTFGGCVLALRLTRTPHAVLGPPGVRGLLVLRGIIGFFGLNGFYASLKYLSLADATVITFLSPILTGFLCSVFLDERFTLKEIAAGCASLFGVLLIARPKSIFGKGHHDAVGGPVGEESVVDRVTTSDHRDVTEAQRIFAICIALMGTLGSAGAYTTIRKIGTRASPLHSVSFFALYSTLASLLLGWYNSEHWQLLPEGDTALRVKFFLLLLLCGVFGFVAQLLAAMGLQREKGGRATVTVYTQAIWSSLFQVVFLHDGIAPLSALGCTIILSAALTVALTK